MQILGIDPGTTDRNPTGYALVDTDQDVVLRYGLLKPITDQPFVDLASQFDNLLGILWLYNAGEHPHRMAIETPWIGVNAHTGIVLAELVGAYKAVWAVRTKHPYVGIAPTQAKAALCDGRATKNDMRRAVQLRYGLAVPSHIADAIGVALACVGWPEQEPTP